MRQVICIAAIAAVIGCMVGATAVSALGGGHIGLYADDPGWSECNLVETVFAINNVYVVHDMVAEAQTSEFMVQDTWGATHAGENYGSNLTLGNLYTGITITYVGCKALPRLLCTASFFPTAPTPACTWALIAVPDPALASGVIEVVDCNNQVVEAWGSWLIVNGNETCPCCVCVSTKETTWSKVKALYN